MRRREVEEKGDRGGGDRGREEGQEEGRAGWLAAASSGLGGDTRRGGRTERELRAQRVIVGMAASSTTRLGLLPDSGGG